MKTELVQHAPRLLDAKVATATASSGGAWMLSVSETFGPMVDFTSGLVAITAGIMAIVLTGIRIYDRYNSRNAEGRDRSSK